MTIITITFSVVMVSIMMIIITAVNIVSARGGFIASITTAIKNTTTIIIVTLSKCHYSLAAGQKRHDQSIAPRVVIYRRVVVW